MLLIILATVFNKHLNERGLTYFQHMYQAIIIGFSLIVAGFKVIVHAVLPFFWPTAASDLVKNLYRDLHPPQ